MFDKLITMTTVIFAAIGGILSSCSGKESASVGSPAPSQSQNVVVNTPPQPPPTLSPQLPPTLPSIAVFQDKEGGYCIEGKSLQQQKSASISDYYSGSQLVSAEITDASVLISMVIENSKKIEEYSKLINGNAGFERRANLANLQRVIDWSSFIADSQHRIRQLASSSVSPEVEEAFKYGEKLEYYRQIYNQIEN